MVRDNLNTLCRFVEDLKHLSKCTDKKVAAIITDLHLQQIYSIGVNGGPKGLQNCLCMTDSKYSCLHAEQNALIKCQDVGRKIMIVSMAPCIQCAAAIINAPGSFDRVYYLEDWKSDEGLILLQRAGISTIKVGDYNDT